MVIGEFSRITGISAYTLRYYEKKGLIRVNRDSAGRRDYCEDDVEWVKFIQRLKDTGMFLRDIKHYSDLRYEGDGTVKERMEMLLEHRKSVLEEQKRWKEYLHNLDEKIDIYQKRLGSGKAGAVLTDDSPRQCTLYLIGGTMGVGKTTTCQILKRKLADSVFLDGDWCWDMSPFQVTAETKEMVLENIIFLLNRFIHCSAYKNVIFCWVMHEQEIVNRIISRLDGDGCKIYAISLVCSREELQKRLQKDVDAGIRTGDIIARSLERMSLYESLDTIKIDVSADSPEQAAERIAQWAGKK